MCFNRVFAVASRSGEHQAGYNRDAHDIMEDDEQQLNFVAHPFEVAAEN